MSVPQKSFEPAAACPLDGVRVVDMSRLVSGNMVSLQLADFGAEVIKIEDPQKGDPLRAWQTDGVSVHWKVYSRNKKSVALSLIDQFMADPHVTAREILVEVPDTEMGHLPMHNIIPRLSATPGHLRRPAPGLGEHTAEILGALGLDRAEIDGLAREGIIGLAGDAS